MFFRRIGLFLLTNILIVVTLSVVTNLLGIQPYLTQSGLNYGSLAAFCLVWGMGGAFISLLLSKMMAKWMTGAQVIDPKNPGQFGWLVDLINQVSRTAGLPVVPEIAVYDSPEPNAFATGPSQRNALVAFSTGLLHRMNKDEIAGVAAHELAHVKNGDMVTMTLLQGVLNAVVMFFARIIAYVASSYVKEEQQVLVRFIATIVFEIFLGILAALVVNWFSRQREFRADSGAAKYVGKQKMIAALESLKRTVAMPQVEEAPALATMKISGRKRAGLAVFFMTHPSLDDRIAALEKM